LPWKWHDKYTLRANCSYIGIVKAGFIYSYLPLGVFKEIMHPWKNLSTAINSLHPPPPLWGQTDTIHFLVTTWHDTGNQKNMYWIRTRNFEITKYSCTPCDSTVSSEQRRSDSFTCPVKLRNWTRHLNGTEHFKQHITVSANNWLITCLTCSESLCSRYGTMYNSHTCHHGDRGGPKGPFESFKCLCSAMMQEKVVKLKSTLPRLTY
jgi:hypothetical protein